MDPLTLAVAATPSFIASSVEFVEALTIVLAVGTTRGWRAPLVGAALAVLTLALIVAVIGVALVTVVPRHVLQLVVGILLLLFGLRWLRKAILRFAGIVALHDEDVIYQREVAALRAQGERAVVDEQAVRAVPDRADGSRHLALQRARPPGAST